MRDDHKDMDTLVDALRAMENEARILSHNAPKRRYSRKEKESVIKEIIQASINRLEKMPCTREAIVHGERKQFPGFSIKPFEVAIEFTGQQIGNAILTDNSIEIWFADAGKVMNVHWLKDQIEICSYRMIGQWEDTLLNLLREA